MTETDLNMVIHYISLLNLLFVFLINVITKRVSDYLFFLDKAKSFKRSYKKEHSFLYKWLFCYVYNKKYMSESKYRKHIILFYVFNLLMSVYGIVLLIIGSNLFVEINLNSYYKYFEIALIVITFSYILWFQLHCEGKGYLWWWPKTWAKGEFRMNLK